MYSSYLSSSPTFLLLCLSSCSFCASTRLLADAHPTALFSSVFFSPLFASVYVKEDSVICRYLCDVVTESDVLDPMHDSNAEVGELVHLVSSVIFLASISFPILSKRILL